MEIASVSRMPVAEAVVDHLDEFFEVEWLENRVADGVRRDLVDAAFSSGCEDDNMRTSAVRILRVYPVDEFVAVDFRHHEVEEDQIDLAVSFQLLEPDRPVLGQLDVESHAFQDSLKKNADGQVVIDDEDFAAVSIDLTDHSRQPHSLLRIRCRADA